MIVGRLTRTTLMVGAVGLGALGCTTAVPTATPDVEKMGATVLRYRGPQIDAVLSHRFASQSLGEEWLMLDLAVTGDTNASVEINRDRVSLRLPSGEIVPLPSQEEFGAAYGSLGAAVQRADIAAEPLDYWAGRVPCALPFQVAPGEGVALLSVWVNDRRACRGRLYFLVPGDVQVGSYALKIELDESDVAIPFRLEAR